MRLCPECTSDCVERYSYVALRVLGCLLLLSIPNGILLCWLPFVFPNMFRCHVCGYRGDEKQLLNLDWRDRETFQKKYYQLEEKLHPIMGKWFLGDEGELYKVTRGRGQFLLLKIQDREITPFRILDYVAETLTPELNVKDISAKFRVFKKFIPRDELELSDFGQGLLTEEEFVYINKGNLKELQQNLEEDGKLIETIKLEIEGKL